MPPCAERAERDDTLAEVHANTLLMSRLYEVVRAACVSGDFDEMDRSLVEAELIRKRVGEMNEHLQNHREEHGC